MHYKSLIIAQWNNKINFIKNVFLFVAKRLSIKD